MERIDHIETNMALTFDEVERNIRSAEKLGIREIWQTSDWREGMPIAIVGGGPSLKQTLPELRRYENIMVCGSAHDWVVSQGIIPKWCVVCDPDPVMANYLRRAHWDTMFLVASQCDRAVFAELDDRKMALWHCGGSLEDNEALWGGKQTVVIGGGTTVATRAMVIAMSFGFSHLHLFGMDNCVADDGATHAYPMSTDRESIGPLWPITIGQDGPTFKMAKYHVAQLNDFKKMLGLYAHKMQIQVNGGGALAELMRASREDRKAA